MHHILFLLFFCIYTSANASSIGPGTTALTAPISNSANKKNCKNFAWWWYISADMWQDDRTRATIQSDAFDSGCNIGEFCSSCNMLNCTIQKTYYACRNLCENQAPQPHFFDLGIAHKPWYEWQKMQFKVPIPDAISGQKGFKPLRWARAYYPQADKLVNLGWNAKKDPTIAQGIPFPFDLPQIAFSAGIASTLPKFVINGTSELTTTTNGQGYVQVPSTNNPLTSGTMQVQQQIAQQAYTNMTNTIPGGSGTVIAY